MKGIEFTQVNKSSKNCSYAIVGNDLYLKFPLDGERYTNDKGTEMLGGAYGAIGEGDSRVRLSCTVFSVKNKAKVVEENAALRAKIAELEAAANK